MILDMIQEWFKELLIDGIISNLTGMFDTLNTKVASVLVIGGTSIPASIIPGKSDRAQGFLKSLVKAHNLRYSSSLFRCLCGSASLGFSSRASTF